MKSKQKKILVAAVFVLLAVFTFTMSMLTPWVWDDIFYGFNWLTGDPIRTIGDVFESQYHHYLTINGRFVAHFICQLIIPFGNHFVFALLVALMSMALLYMTVLLGAGRKFGLGTVLSATAMLLLIETNFSPVYQVGYIWMSLLVFVFIYIYLYKASQPARRNLLQLCLLFVFSVIAGNAHESICIGVGGAIFFFCLFNIKRVTLAQWVMSVGFGIGALFLCLSPGIIARSNNTDIPLLYTIFSAVTKHVSLLLLFAILAVYRLRKLISIRAFYRENTFLCNAVLTLLVFHSVIGIGAATQLFGEEIINIVLILRVLRHHRFGRVSLVLLYLVVAVSFYPRISSLPERIKEYNDINTALQHLDGDTIYVDLPEMSYWPGLGTLLSSQHCLVVGNTRDINKNIVAYPTIFKQIRENGGNAVYKYKQNCYMLVQDKANPARFVLHRKLGWKGVGVMPMADYNVVFDENSTFNTADRNVMFINESSPFIINTSVEIVGE